MRRSRKRRFAEQGEPYFSPLPVPSADRQSENAESTFSLHGEPYFAPPLVSGGVSESVTDAEYEEVKPDRDETSGPDRPEEIVTFKAGWFISAAIAIAGISALFWQEYVGAFILAGWMLHIATCLHEVRDPNEGFLFRMGRCIGRLKSGWYLTIPHLWDIVPLVREWTAVHFSDPELYTADEPARRFEATGVLFFRTKDVAARMTKKEKHAQLEQLLLMPFESMKEKAEAVGLAELRRLFGEKKERDLIREKELMEQRALERLRREFEVHGYELQDYEITRMDGADAKIRARGESVGYANKRMADPLKNNYPGAVGIAVHELGQVAERLVKPYLDQFTRKAGTATLSPDLEKRLREFLGQTGKE